MKATSEVYPRLVVHTPEGTVQFVDGAAEVTAAQAKHLDEVEGVAVDQAKRTARKTDDD